MALYFEYRINKNALLQIVFFLPILPTRLGCKKKSILENTNTSYLLYICLYISLYICVSTGWHKLTYKTISYCQSKKTI